jgi:hypothetical protein
LRERRDGDDHRRRHTLDHGRRRHPPLDVHVAAALDDIGGVLGVESFEASAAGNDKLVCWLSSFGTITRVGVEGTGSYGAGLARFLRAGGGLPHPIVLATDDRAVKAVPFGRPAPGLDCPRSSPEGQKQSTRAREPEGRTLR